MKRAILIETDRSMERYFSKLMQKKLGYSVCTVRSIEECRELLHQQRGFKAVVCNYDVTTDEEDQIVEFVRSEIPAIEVYLTGYINEKEVVRRGEKVAFCTTGGFLEMFSHEAKCEKVR